MHCYTKIDEDLFYVGYSSRRINLFENVYPVPEGISYNSYLLTDEKTALFDTVDSSVVGVFMENLKAVLSGRKLDYLVVNHVEPDHSWAIKAVLSEYGDVKIICSALAKKMIEQFFGSDVASRVSVIETMTELDLGKHKISFIKAPMVHWPEVIFSYDKTNKTLFSADAFGSFGAIVGSLFADDFDFDEKTIEMYRRYYINIVGKYGMPVQNVLKAASGIDIERICPLHGRIWRKDLKKIIDLYDKWSSFEPERQGVLIAYASVYGGTELVANKLANCLARVGVSDTSMFDVSVTHPSYLLSELAKYSHLVLASTTYNMGIFVNMENLVNDIVSHAFENRKVVVIENGSWAPSAKNLIVEKLKPLKNFEIIDSTLTVKSTLGGEQESDIEKIAQTIADTMTSRAK